MHGIINRLSRRILLVATIALATLIGGASAASAATLYISEYANIGAIGSSPTPWPPGAAVTTQTVAIGGASVSSSAFNGATHAIQAYCDTGCSIQIGSSPTATTSMTVLTTNQPQNFVVAPGQKIAVIANTSGLPPAPTPSGTQDVNLAQVAGATVATGHGTAAGAIRVELPTDGTGVVGLAAGAAVIGHVIVDSGTITTVTTLTGTTSLTPGTAATNLGKAEDAVHTSGDTGVFDLGVVTDGTTSLAAAGDYSVSARDAAGNSRMVRQPTSEAAIGIAPVVTAAAGSSKVLKASAGNLYGFSCTSGASAGVCYVFDATALPSNGAVTPVDCYIVAATQTLAVAYDPPLVMATGATVGFGTGTNCFSLTASTTAFISGEAK